jgi:threonine/homoserine/homoserine lactone efflux protein
MDANIHGGGRRMTEAELLIKGIIVGLMIAMPVGPVNVLCLHRTIEAGWRSGVSSGLGAAAADMLYGGVAGFSITLVVQFLVREQLWIRFFGGILLVVIGISYFLKRPEPLNAQKEDRRSAYSDMRSTFLLTLTNPTTVLSFLALLAALGIGVQRQWWLTAFLVLGIFCGSMAWWIVLSSIVNLFRNRFDDRILLWMNRFAGLAIGGFGVAAFFLRSTLP